ncbi:MULTISPECIES: hypothetical protein [Streptomyces]|uniref:Secreted protein n=1 Tax=Streptomyces heilongjiangensis TaxID=945052 RepID=A0ABW1BDD1_9ACTN|nr:MULTISPECIES: hypothetical protein [Streptomyces]MDC2949070.1 hypothetical protein [Streptomyces heilongjiangensis]
MNLRNRRALSATFATTALVTGAFTALPATASAADQAPMRCEGYTYSKVIKLGKPWYASRGPVVSKRNSSSSKSTLVYSIKTTKTRTTTWGGEASASVGWGIAQVEAKTKYEVAKSVAKGRTVTNRMTVDPGKRGYTQPMVEYQKFQVERWRELGNCKHDRIEIVGILKGITSSLHFAECQTRKASCTPKP